MALVPTRGVSATSTRQQMRLGRNVRGSGLETGRPPALTMAGGEAVAKLRRKDGKMKAAGASGRLGRC